MARKAQEKFPIEWHEECLKNSMKYAAELRTRLSNLQKEIERIEFNNESKKAKIELAKSKGIKEFSPY